MKVLHLISGGDTGGAKTHVFALLGKLKEQADVTVVCFMKGVFWDELQDIDVKSELMLQKSRFDMSVVERLEKLCADGFDIVHCHGARANFIGASLKKRIHIPMITTIHSDYLLDFDGFYRKLVYTSLNVLALKKFDNFIAVSENFRQMLISRGFRPNAVYTVYNGMDYSGTPAFVSKEEFAERIGISYDPSLTYIGLIGRHDFVKGHDVFIKAIAKVCAACPDTRFIIAGEGENRASLVELAEREGVTDHLIFAGFVKDIYSFIHFIDINTLTSRSESFPYVLMEGARFAKPTVCSAVGGIPDFVIDGKTGFLFPSEDSGALADKLIRLIRDKALAERFGKALHELALAKFSDTALAARHMEIYRAVLRDHYDDKKYDAVLSGYYGFGNSGDDALLFAITESLRKYVPDIRLCVLSAKPKKMRGHYRIDCAPRFRPLAVWRTLKQSGMLISGGGSLIQDATSSKSLLYYLTVMKLAVHNGAKLYVYANGLGPLKDRNLKRAAAVLERADFITLRDRDSLEELARMGVKNPNVKVTADPALLLAGTAGEPLDDVFEHAGIPADGRYFGVSVRPWKQNDPAFRAKIAAVIDYASRTYGLTPVFLPMSLTRDTKFSEEIEGLLHTPSYTFRDTGSVNDVVGLVSRFEFVLGMRLHTLIYAAGRAVPVIGILYDCKISGFLDYIGEKRMLDAADLDTEKACAYIDELMAERENIRAFLAGQREKLAQLADENARIAADLLAERIQPSKEGADA